jgi:hypothetical protein
MRHRRRKEAVSGRLRRMHALTGVQVSTERVVLKRDREWSNLILHDYPSLDVWTRDAEAILKRLGPQRQRE